MSYFWHGFAWHLGRMFAHMAGFGAVVLLLVVVILIERGRK